jgi:hypothetical protein
VRAFFDEIDKESGVSADEVTPTLQTRLELLAREI